jgi:cell division protein ZapA (FtsZ GTPase activity inhibitor)
VSAAKTSVTVRIAGEEHTIRASAEPAYTRKCAELVDERIHQIRLQAGLIEGHKAAILAALSIADECFQAQEELTTLRGELADRAHELARRLADALPESAPAD